MDSAESHHRGGQVGEDCHGLGKRLSKRQEKDELVNRNILKDNEAVSPTILQTKLSLEKEKNQDHLNRRLSNRPSKVDLKLRNILRVESDDVIDQAGVSLQKNMDFDRHAIALRSILKRRPSKCLLEDMNIIRGGGSVDPSLIETQEKLRRAQLENSLDGKLRNRPDMEELADKHILHFNETVEVLPTFRKSEYNRKPDGNATFRKLTPQMKTEMSVHEESLRNTCFH
ncbi:hypothetical protein BC829DRAFT_406759 [Chytridium lagenaria]|nr:hypothetical protein BC829DRAFT_406759 [Chytridium lagenaria]